MRNIVFTVFLLLLCSSVEAAHMIKDNRHESERNYPDNRMTGYEFLGWGFYGPGAPGYGCEHGGYGNMGHHGMMPGMTGYGMGPGMWGYDADRNDKFMHDTAEMRKELHIRQFDYNEALRNRDLNHNDLIKMETEILELQMKIREKWWNRID